MYHPFYGRYLHFHDKTVFLKLLFHYFCSKRYRTCKGLYYTARSGIKIKSQSCLVQHANRRHYKTARGNFWVEIRILLVQCCQTWIWPVTWKCVPHKMFLRISLVDTFQMKNPNDATLASLSILKYSKIQKGRQMAENIAKINIIHVYEAKSSLLLLYLLSSPGSSDHAISRTAS